MGYRPETETSDYLVVRRNHVVNGKAYGPGDVIPNKELPRPRAFLKLGWVKKVQGGGLPSGMSPPSEGAPVPDVKPLTWSKSKSAPVKKKRGRPKKT